MNLHELVVLKSSLKPGQSSVMSFGFQGALIKSSSIDFGARVDRLIRNGQSMERIGFPLIRQLAQSN